MLSELASCGLVELSPDWANWVAQDADGAWWTYEVEALQYHKGWYENELGRKQKIAMLEIPENWCDTLTKL